MAELSAAKPGPCEAVRALAALPLLGRWECRALMPTRKVQAGRIPMPAARAAQAAQVARVRMRPAGHVMTAVDNGVGRIQARRWWMPMARLS